MIPKYLSLMWAAIAPALGNHLWQSTVFTIVAGLLTLLLRKNHARARYWLWLAASVKFLVPFSLLVGIGSHLSRSRSSASGLYFALEEVSQPFTQPTMSTISRAAPSAVSTSLIHLLPALLAMWVCGFVVVLFVWCARWRRISAAIREAVPLQGGREVEALRRLEHIGGLRKRIEMLSSPLHLEPGVFGIARPVLLWPEGISERLEDANLNAILAHELWHVRRRDNLAATIHMVVEAVFWFHPLVWWLGARLVAERERACDEEVLELGTERQVYAESILTVCEFCVRSPLDCVSGVTGADLKKRIVRIMTERRARKLDFSRKLLLGVVGLVAIAMPIEFGLANETQSRAQSQAEETIPSEPLFETVSIKPDRTGIDYQGLKTGPDELTATNATLQMLIGSAYGIDDSQIAGVPDWVNSDRYDIEAKVYSAVADELRKDQPWLVKQLMLQALLADRFDLIIHRETKEVPVYDLVIAKDGPKLQQSTPGDTYPHGRVIQVGSGQIAGQEVPVTTLARLLSEELGRTVRDKTGLPDHYAINLQWTPDENQLGMSKGMRSGQQETDNAFSPESSESSIFTAIQEQLGLKLEPEQVPMEFFVIDHVEAPSEN